MKQPDYYHATPIQIEKTLSYNANDVQVKHAQEMLKSLGYVPDVKMDTLVKRQNQH